MKDARCTYLRVRLMMMKEKKFRLPDENCYPSSLELFSLRVVNVWYLGRYSSRQQVSQSVNSPPPRSFFSFPFSLFTIHSSALPCPSSITITTLLIRCKTKKGRVQSKTYKVSSKPTKSSPEEILLPFSLPPRYCSSSWKSQSSPYKTYPLFLRKIFHRYRN